MATSLMVTMCSSKSDGPSTWTYTLDFQSVSAAVSVDTLEVSVFDATKEGGECSSLVEGRRTHADLPKAVATVAPAICDVTRGQGSVTVGYGTYSVLVVAKHQGQDWLIGCNKQYVTKDEDPGTLPIEVTNFDDTVLVPATTCQSLSAHCGGGC
jgi:hypothetical protein